MKKRSVNIAGHQTSITLEDEFWAELQSLAQTHNLSINTLVATIDEQRTPEQNLSSAIRLYILRSIKQKSDNAAPAH